MDADALLEALAELVAEKVAARLPKAPAPMPVIRPGKDEWLTTVEAAKLLKVGRSTLEQWRAEGKGPDYGRVGPRVRYRRSDLERWALERHRI